MERTVMSIGQSTVIKGELTASEDLTIDGRVEGKIELKSNKVTIGEHAQISAEVVAQSVLVIGQVTGNITASEKVDIRETGRVEGDLVAPKVAMADGAHFRGKIDMTSSQAKPTAPGQSKAAGDVVASELARRPAATGVSSTAKVNAA